MCGIVGAVNGSNVVSALLSGLERLEYRGYDSAGLACTHQDVMVRRRSSGPLKNLRSLLDTDPVEGRIGIAHTRWATHGAPNARNAHPHVSGAVAVVHNGIIENHDDLRRRLQAEGMSFESDTDSEVIPHLITRGMATGLSFEGACVDAFNQLEGAYAVVAMAGGTGEERFVAARRGSPLILGYAPAAAYVASDAMAISDRVETVCYLEEGDVAFACADGVEITDANGIQAERVRRATTHTATPELAGFDDYMRKEIHEQPEVLTRALQLSGNPAPGHQEEAGPDLNDISQLDIVACGTSAYAGGVAKYWFEALAGVPVDVDIASEYRYRDRPVRANSAALLISQSGETADTLAALRQAKQDGITPLALVNVTESSLARESAAVFPLHAGPEIGVASTKAFTAQLIGLASLVLDTAASRRGGADPVVVELVADLIKTPAAVQGALETEAVCAEVGGSLKEAASAIYLGRGPAMPLAYEGALKLKEISYIHAEGFGAGELKHGPIALIEEGTPVIAVAPGGRLMEKTLSNLEEVKARGARVIAITDTDGAEEVARVADTVIAVPASGPVSGIVAMSVPLQLIAYYAAKARGHDVDKPRNLAKSVTVE